MLGPEEITNRSEHGQEDRRVSFLTHQQDLLRFFELKMSIQ